MIIAPYVTPENSLYKVSEIFSIIDSVTKIYPNSHIFLLGDLNSRCGVPVSPNFQYSPNPDVTVNSHGKKLLQLCNDNNMLIVNGLNYNLNSFDTDFTFFRGSVKSQNDWCATNFIEGVLMFSIISKPLSDHCPRSIKICVPKIASLGFIDDISGGTLSYEQYGRSKIIKPKIKLERINTDNLMKRFDDVADYIGKTLQNDNVDTNYLSIMVNDKIYEACSTKKKRDDITCIPVDKKDLNSHNFRAIAEANLRMYNISIQRNNNLDQTAVYYKTWESTLAYAAVKEREEYNTKVNISWRFTSKNNPKKLWKMIDYDDKGLKSVTSTYSVRENLIHNYFSDVFQAKRLEANPTVADIKRTLEAYNVYIPVMDDDFIFDGAK